MAATSSTGWVLAIAGFVFTLLGGRADAQDLVGEMYHAATRSPHVVALAGLEDLDELVGRGRPKAALAVMFHERSCHICHGALPEFVEVARDFQARGLDMHFAHMECSGIKDAVKSRAHLLGFPSILVFRPLESNARWPASGLINQTLAITDDRAFLLRACRLAGMAEERDHARVRHLGMEGRVLVVDLLDGTARLAIGPAPGTWFPLEALRPSGSSGAAAAVFRRAEAAKSYDSSWKAGEMGHFLRRMLHPLVAAVASQDDAVEAVAGERFPAFVFCGRDVTLGFLEAAARFQGKVRAFHANRVEACPVPLAAEGPHVVVCAPPGALWHATPRFAAAVAGPEVVLDDAALAEWLGRNRFPGVTALDFHNFWDFLNAGRRGLVIALRDPRAPSLESEAALKALRDVARPDGNGVFRYGEESLNLAVVDGGIAGLDAFGVSPDRLPRVVVFEGPHAWVEDVDELTVHRLRADLEKLPALWRSSNDVMGYARSCARRLAKAYSVADGLVADAAGGHPASRGVLPAVVVGAAWAIVALARSVVQAMGESDETRLEGAPKKTQ